MGKHTRQRLNAATTVTFDLHWATVQWLPGARSQVQYATAANNVQEIGFVNWLSDKTQTAVSRSSRNFRLYNVLSGDPQVFVLGPLASVCYLYKICCTQNFTICRWHWHTVNV